ncbi:hypothetical protein C8J57DRAFT_711710 [Mycena rebaudengoi]|nr:hypothetical protein C8J57DRAFT_711710 [Mycena rebaudengoi]
MKFFAPIASVLPFIAYAAAHGTVTIPTPRAIGAANVAACGATVNSILKSDKFGPIENAGLAPVTYNTTACHLFFCRGYQLEDNLNNTRVYSPGTAVAFHVSIEAHHTGFANVSVVNLVTQTPIARLFTWPVYANDTLGPPDWPKNESDFTVTIPNLGSQCAKVGQCAIQWWWWGTQVKQTFESCVDFTQ